MRLPRRSAFVIAGLTALARAAGACRPATPAPSGREALASAVSTTLPFQARLSGGFAPSTARTDTRGRRSRSGTVAGHADRDCAARKACNREPDTRSTRGSWRRLPDSRRRRSRDRDDRGRGVATDGAGTVERSQRRVSGESGADAGEEDRIPRARARSRREIVEDRAAQTMRCSIARLLETASRRLPERRRRGRSMPRRKRTRRGETPHRGTPPKRSAGGRAARSLGRATPRAARRLRPATRVRQKRSEQYPEASIEFLEREIFVDPGRLQPPPSSPRPYTKSPAIRWRATKRPSSDSTRRRSFERIRVYADGVNSSTRTISPARAVLRGGAGRPSPASMRPFARCADFGSRRLIGGNELDSRSGVSSRVEQEADRGYTILLAPCALQRGSSYNRQWR